MIQLTHLGRRAHWGQADWLPTVSPSGVREPAHRAFPKIIEDWDIERIVADYALAAEHMQAACRRRGSTASSCSATGT
jgi:2,4-dienoyl-CoA reductase-like NADH-dependent reductase (Old Yellow Enzyme family)